MWTGNHISWDIASPLSCPKSIWRVANNIYLECTRQKSSITSVQPGINSTHCKNMTKYTCNLVRSKCIPKKSNKNTKKLYVKLTWKEKGERFSKHLDCLLYQEHPNAPSMAHVCAPKKTRADQSDPACPKPISLRTKNLRSDKRSTLIHSLKHTLLQQHFHWFPILKVYNFK